MQVTGSYTSRACNATTTLSAGNQTTIISEAIYELNSTTNITHTRQYTVTYTYQGQFSLKSFIDDLTAFSSAGFNDFTRMFIGFLVVFALLAWLSKEASLRDPEILVVLFLVMVLILSYIGWFTLHIESIPDVGRVSKEWTQQYIVFILLSLAGGSYLVKKYLV
jgi:hypothetical protein